MDYFNNTEIKITKKFLEKGYLISKSENIKSLRFIKELVIKYSCKILKKKNINLNEIHKYLKISELNDFRLEIISKINNTNFISNHYFNNGRKLIYTLVGNELMMQNNINLSIQFPNDNSSLLPIHSDVWSGDSPYELNLWIPLVNCFKTKSMYILEKKNEKLLDEIKKKNINNSEQIFNYLKKHLRWLKINYGEVLIFNQSLPHGNIINREKETRWSLNCRFKSVFSPYDDKKIGEFFKPITLRPATMIGIKYKSPFK